jgi:hypothetical protein
VGNKINLKQMLKDIKEDESMETLKEKKWASQEDIKQLIEKKKVVNKKAE